MTLSKRGATRFVILTQRWAFKIPRFWGCNPHGRFTMVNFLHGLLANMQERQFAAMGWPELCPVRFSIPGGWLVVMPRIETLTEELSEEEYARFVEQLEYRIPAENKADSFGWYRGRLVAVDYGS